jgi:hypothetical protein
VPPPSPSLLAGMELKTTADQLGRSTIVLTADTYTKSRELHLEGEVCEVCPRAKGLSAAVTAYSGSSVTRAYSGTGPSDA